MNKRQLSVTNKLLKIYPFTLKRNHVLIVVWRLATLTRIALPSKLCRTCILCSLQVREKNVQENI